MSASALPLRLLLPLSQLLLMMMMLVERQITSPNTTTTAANHNIVVMRDTLRFALHQTDGRTDAPADRRT